VARAVDDMRIDYSTTFVDGKMDDGTPQLVWICNFTYRIRFEELLEVVDNIAFRAMDERLEFYLKRNADASGSKDLRLSHQEHN
jgi:CRP/FNR family transcriptional regulator